MSLWATSQHSAGGRELERMMGGKPFDSLVAKTLEKAGHKA